MTTNGHSAEWELVSGWMGTLRDLSGIAQLAIVWDQETQMPDAGAPGRAHLAGTLAVLSHRELVREDVGEALDALDAAGGGDGERADILRLARRDRERATAIPERLAQAIAEGQSRCLAAWHEAKSHDDFAPFAAAFAPLLALKREEAQAIGIGDEPYDSLLDAYEPGARAADLVPLFADLATRLVPIVRGARERGPAPLPPRTWPVERQRLITEHVARMMGFDMDGGVIGVTAHPFTVSVHPGDTRFSTAFDEATPVPNILITLHEGGHAVYDQGFPADAARTVLYDAPSLGAHESQSRFYEMHVGGEPAFWRALEPRLREAFPAEMEGIDVDDLRREAFAVTPGAVRLESDEVTYNLHIALRFELERALVRGDLAIADLPQAWSDRVEELLGVRPKGHADGVLQDIHWASGAIGYFPTYTLGNIYAAQLRSAMEETLGPLDGLIEAGAYPEILGFMRERVHRHGRSLDTRELMRRATGRELDASDLIAHLERRNLG